VICIPQKLPGPPLLETLRMYRFRLRLAGLAHGSLLEEDAGLAAEYPERPGHIKIAGICGCGGIDP